MPAFQLSRHLHATFSLGLEYAIVSLVVLRVAQRFPVSKSGMRNGDNLYNDGLTSACKNNGQTTWSVIPSTTFIMPLADLRHVGRITR
jgi:hypothetical protein